MSETEIRLEIVEKYKRHIEEYKGFLTDDDAETRARAHMAIMICEGFIDDLTLLFD